MNFGKPKLQTDTEADISVNLALVSFHSHSTCFCQGPLKISNERDGC